MSNFKIIWSFSADFHESPQHKCHETPSTESCGDIRGHTEEQTANETLSSESCSDIRGQTEEQTANETPSSESCADTREHTDRGADGQRNSFQ